MPFPFPTPRVSLAAFAALFLLASAPADATIRLGDIQIAGNLESQQLIRLDRDYRDTFSAFDLVQQRNTFRIQYEHELVERGKLWETEMKIPGVKDAALFAYYRFVYDSVYDTTPGPRFREQTGGVAGSFDRLSSRARDSLRFENVIREAYLDVDLASLPVSLRIGRQQIVFGNSINFRATDIHNALDLSWHLQQEAGLLGRVGFSELRIPEWGLKILWNSGSLGPFSSSYFEVYDFPFNFEPTRASFYPRPWSVPVRNPFRGGLVLDAAAASGVPSPVPLLLQPCFDTTGNPAPNAAANADFSQASETGLCPSEGRQRSRLGQGIYDSHDPTDVNTFGARFGSMIPNLGSMGFALSYRYGRHIADATGGGVAKAQVGAVNSNTLGYVQIAPHTTVDRLTGEENLVVGYARVPIEFYYPYVHSFGIATDYFEEYSGAVLNFEASANKGVPISTADPTGNGINRKWEIETAFLIDRPTWIRFLNRRSTFNVLFQTNASILPGHDSIEVDASGAVVNGDVGVPNTTLIPGQFGAVDRLDERHQVELLSLLAMQTFYRGGSISPLLALVSDWTNAPSIEVQFFFQYLPTNNLIIEPGTRIFWTNGRIVDDRYQVSKNAGRSELQIKVTYQF